MRSRQIPARGRMWRDRDPTLSTATRLPSCPATPASPKAALVDTWRNLPGNGSLDAAPYAGREMRDVIGWVTANRIEALSPWP